MTGALRRVQPDRGLNVNRGAMLRRLVTLIVLLLACALAQAQPLAVIPPLTGPVIDTTMTLGAATKQQLEAQALALQQRKGSQLQVLIIPSTQPEDIAQYAVRVYDEYKLGRKGTNDGVLLVVAKDDRRAWIATGYGLEGAIPDATAFRVIQEYLLPKFRAGDFDGGVTDATAALVKLIDGEALPAPMVKERRQGKGSGFLFALFAAFIVAQIARAFLNPVPSFLRGIIGGAAAGGIAWLLSSVLVAGGIGALIGFFVGLASLPSGRYASDRGWGGFGGGGGGGWGGGGFGGGGGGGGGWSGGGGMTGGGGAGGSW